MQQGGHEFLTLLLSLLERFLGYLFCNLLRLNKVDIRIKGLIVSSIDSPGSHFIFSQIWTISFVIIWCLYGCGHKNPKDITKLRRWILIVSHALACHTTMRISWWCCKVWWREIVETKSDGKHQFLVDRYHPNPYMTKS